MPIVTHKLWPGMVLFETEHGTVLCGVPADAFKVTKSYCTEHRLPMPVVLAAPKRGLVDCAPQFVPEFFLYDFLFVRGAAFKPDLAHEKLQIVVDPGYEERELNALRLTLYGPTREEMESYRAEGNGLTDEHIDFIARVSEHMAIKRGGGDGGIRDMVSSVAYDENETTELFDAAYTLRRLGDFEVELRAVNGDVERASLKTEGPVPPFNPVPRSTEVHAPMRFGLQALGVRGGFDPSGPTTGFLIWIGGRGILFDGPPKARQVLDSQGVSPSDIDALILSHCHEDHMASFAELVLELDRPRVLTTEPIYRSALQKLSTNLQMSEDDVAALMDYQPISPGEPHQGWGAELDFFYTVHPIPTLGVHVRTQIDGEHYRITISGDTIDLDGLDKMHAAGVVTDEERDAMRAIVPPEKIERAVFYTDVGESLIHGHPKDWAKNPNDIYYYHCPNNDHTRSFKHRVGDPGQRHVLVPGNGSKSLAKSRLMRALSPLGSEEPQRLVENLNNSEIRSLAAGDRLAEAGANVGRFAVVLTGTLEQNTRPLRSGDCLGLFYGVDDGQRALGDVVALTPADVLELDVELIERHLLDSGLANVPTVIRRQLRFVDRIAAFRSLDVADRCRLARQLHLEQHAAGRPVLDREQNGDDVLVLLQGSVTRHQNGDDDELNANSSCPVLAYNGVSQETRIEAKSDVIVGRLPGWLVRELSAKRMSVRLGLGA